MTLTKWDRRFLRIAYEVSSWSKDVGTRVGSVLVCDRRIIATGYNGFPSKISDTLERRESQSFLQTQWSKETLLGLSLRKTLHLC